jgi:hypothetical protein
MKRVVLIFVVLGFSQIALGDDLCLPKEKVVFSGAPLCEPNNAISVCLDKGGNNTVRYRNMDETLIEFDAEVRKCVVTYSGGGGIHLTFTNEEDSFQWWSVNEDKGWIFKKDGVAAPSPTQCSLTGKPQLTSVTFDDQYLPPVEEWNCEGLWW